MQLDIRHKALLFIGAAGIATSLLLGGLLLTGLNTAEKLIHSHADNIGSKVTAEAEKFVQQETQKRLEGTLRLQAGFLNSVMMEMEGDVFTLSQKVSQLVQDSSQPPQRVYDPRKETITSGQLYYLAGASGGEPSPLVQRLAAIAPTLDNLTKSYDASNLMFFIGSKEGWSLRMNFLADKALPIQLPPEAMTTSYDARQRVWYKAGEQAFGTNYPVYAPIYTALGDVPMMACVMAYEDEQGFAGVVGIAAPPATVYHELKREITVKDKQSFVLNNYGQVVFSSQKEGALVAGNYERDLRQDENSDLAGAAAAMTEGQTGSRILNVDGTEYCLVYTPVGDMGWSMGQLEELDEIEAPAQAIGLLVAKEIQDVQASVHPLFPRLRIALICAFLLLMLMLAWMSWRWAKNFTEPIRQLADGASEVAEGQFSKRLELHTGDEVETLAESFNDMTAALQSHMDDLAAVTEDKARVAAGLEVAASIQQGLLPRDFPTGTNFALYADMEPAKEVGGDFYDFYFLDEHHLALTMADVSDKGVPAALFMVVARTLLKNSLMSTKDLAAAFRDTNNQLAEENNEGLFVTVFSGVLDIRTGEFTYVNGGHCPPLVKGSEGIRELPKGRSPMLGIREGLNFSLMQAQLAPGELLFLFTDGVTEAMNENKEMFGRERLEEILAAATPEDSPQEVLTALHRAIRDYSGAAEQSDDITMLALRWKK